MQKINIGVFVNEINDKNIICEVLKEIETCILHIGNSSNDLNDGKLSSLNIIIIDYGQTKLLENVLNKKINIQTIFIVDEEKYGIEENNCQELFRYIYRPINKSRLLSAVKISNQIVNASIVGTSNIVNIKNEESIILHTAILSVALGWIDNATRKLHQGGNLKKFYSDLVEQMMCLANAKYGALGFIKNDGSIEEFIYYGFSEKDAGNIDVLAIKKGISGNNYNFFDFKNDSNKLENPFEYIKAEIGFCASSIIDIDFKVGRAERGIIYIAEKYCCHPFDSYDKEILKITSLEAERALEHNQLLLDLREQNFALAGTQSRLKHLFKSSPAMTYSALPGPNYIVTFVSDNVETQLGFTPKEILQEPTFWLTHIHPEDREEVIKGIAIAIQKKRKVFEFRFKTKTGTYKWLRDEIRAVYDRDGNPLEVVGSCLDITEQKLTQEELKKSHNELRDAYARLQETQDQLLHSEKMASIGQLAAGVAHEINNPIGYISSNLGSLRKYIDDIFKLLAFYKNLESRMNNALVDDITKIKQDIDIDFLIEDLQNLLRESDEGIHRVKNIVRDLKDFAHVDNYEWQTADIHKGLDSTLNIVHNELKYKAQIIKKYGQIPCIECLPTQLNQIFMNILVNAAHAIEDRGEISIKTSLDDQYFVTVEIEDTGKGISPENLPKIFDPFFTTKPVGKGTGLGLYISYGIVKKHGGTIDVTSEVGKGTRFIIRLPVMQPLDKKDDKEISVGRSN